MSTQHQEIKLYMERSRQMLEVAAHNLDEMRDSTHLQLIGATTRYFMRPMLCC